MYMCVYVYTGQPLVHVKFGDTLVDNNDEVEEDDYFATPADKMDINLYDDKANGSIAQFEGIFFYAHIYIYIYKHIYIYMYVCVHVYIYICVCVYTYICVYIYIYIHVHMGKFLM